VIYSLKDLQDLAAATGFPDPVLAAAVAMAESGGNPCAQGDPNIGVHPCNRLNGTSTSFGLWQINTTWNPQYDPLSLLNPQYNARAALAVSNGGVTWKPWSTFKNESYLKWYSHVVYPPHGGPPIIPQPVTPPIPREKNGRVVAATVGVLAIVAAAGYGAYRWLSGRPEPRPLPPPEPTYPMFRRYEP
jgi:hypothetical protein